MSNVIAIAELTGTLNELADNARRLMRDAELVFASGSHQTAASLSILAIEEVGRYFSVKWHFEKPGDPVQSTRATKGRKAHRMKQVTVASFETAELAIAAVKELLERIGFTPTEENMRIFAWGCKQNDEDSKLVIGVLAKSLAEKMVALGDANFLSLATMGLVDQAKQQGLYVDVDNDGRIIRSPMQMTYELGKTWMEYGRRTLARLPGELT